MEQADGVEFRHRSPALERKSYELHCSRLVGAVPAGDAVAAMVPVASVTALTWENALLWGDLAATIAESTEKPAGCSRFRAGFAMSFDV